MQRNICYVGDDVAYITCRNDLISIMGGRNSAARVSILNSAGVQPRDAPVVSRSTDHAPTPTSADV